MKLAYVIQRYTTEAKAGAEKFCRLFAERLAARGWDIQVLTTCAVDYTSWANELPSGETLESGVRVHRFPVVSERGSKFHFASAQILGNPTEAPVELQEEWMRLQGPEAPALLDKVAQIEPSLDLLIFFTYLYYPTFYGLRRASSKSVLHPLLHNEPPAYLSVFQEMFRQPKALVFATREERAFTFEHFKVAHLPHLIGAGVESSDDNTNGAFRQALNLKDPFVLFLGRLDVAKGAEHLCNWFIKYKARRPGPLKLVLAGEKVFVPPEHPDLIYAGIPDDTEKWSALADAELLIQPSFFESLSLVLLESWMVGTPALVNGYSDVMVGHCRRSGGGAWYRGYLEFETALDRLLGDERLRNELGQRGKSYALTNYSWDRIVDRYQTFLEKVAASL